MAFEEYDDYEQEQLVKEWLGNNWFTIVAGIALGIGGLWGYGQWQNAQLEGSHEAAAEFAQLKTTLDAADTATAADQLAAYEQRHGSNFYVIQSRLELAEKAVSDGDLAAAKSQYESILTTKPDQPIAELVRLRLARLLVAEEDYVGAAQQLDLVTSDAYQTMVEEINGDIYAAQGEAGKAHDAYQLALNAGEGYSGKQIIEMKMADVKANQ